MYAKYTADGLSGLFRALHRFIAFLYSLKWELVTYNKYASAGKLRLLSLYISVMPFNTFQQTRFLHRFIAFLYNKKTTQSVVLFLQLIGVNFQKSLLWECHQRLLLPAVSSLYVYGRVYRLPPPTPSIRDTPCMKLNTGRARFSAVRPRVQRPFEMKKVSAKI